MEVVRYNSDIPASFPESLHCEIFTAYGLYPSNGDNTHLMSQIKKTKRTYTYLQEAVLSNRHPYILMIIASRIGMYIPPRKRTGLDTYRFFLDNVGYYEAVLERSPDTQLPTLYDIYMSKDRTSFLMKFKDDEILRSEFKISRRYTSRKEMIQIFLDHNIRHLGEFFLDNNSRSVYSGKVKVFLYKEYVPSQQIEIKMLYSTDEFISLMDVSKMTIWKDSTRSNSFSRLSLHSLRQQILEKMEQWRQKENLGQVSYPSALCTIYTGLETILGSDIRNDSNVYLGNPQLEI